MWQTVLNGFTFGRNVALGALGRARAAPAEKPWQRRIDAGISVVVAIPALLCRAADRAGRRRLPPRAAAIALRTELL